MSDIELAEKTQSLSMITYERATHLTTLKQDTFCAQYLRAVEDLKIRYWICALFVALTNLEYRCVLTARITSAAVESSLQTHRYTRLLLIHSAFAIPSSSQAFRHRHPSFLLLHLSVYFQPFNCRPFEQVVQLYISTPIHHSLGLIILSTSSSFRKLFLQAKKVLNWVAMFLQRHRILTSFS